MSGGPLRWASSEGVFLFQVPDEELFLQTEIVILLSSSLYAIQIFFNKGEIRFNNEDLNITKLSFHPPFSSQENEDESPGFVVHSSFKGGICFQSIFHSHETTNQLSEFETAFLDSVVSNLLDTLEKEGRSVSDIPFLKDRRVIDEIEEMLHEIDNKYKSLAASWSLVTGSDSDNTRFEFSHVLYNGKIKVEELLYDLGDRAIESFNQLLMGNEEKNVLYKIAKSLVNLSSLLYEKQTDDSQNEDKLKFSHSEIILESVITKRLFRLDVRSYEIDDEPYCDITIMC
ncbi:MAG: hypothetical protein KGD59_01810 [Candidatus Heimdallarchaeota archaeon]|nr:hypothetical protein [Candidatus Heimdallarchaeota archaeon]MBY8993255.1 hypothetical protein [Candidatus Heimdallarchaeota archaeon]